MTQSLMNPTRDDFAALLESTHGAEKMVEGRVIPATVVSIENDAIIVDVGLKTEGRIPLREFQSDTKQPKVGELVEVYLERIENALGDAVLSREKARREEAWNRLEKSSQTMSRSTAPLSAASRAASPLILAALRPSCRAARWTFVRCAMSARSWVRPSPSPS